MSETLESVRRTLCIMDGHFVVDTMDKRMERMEAEIERLTKRDAHLADALNRVGRERDTAMEAVHAMRNMLPLAKEPSTLLSVLESIMDRPEARGETPLLEVE